MKITYSIPEKTETVELQPGVENLQQFAFGLRNYGYMAYSTIRIGFDGTDLHLWADIKLKPEPKDDSTHM